ncbi:hypothetical protein H4683_000596 [Filibacter limicola]|uniref:Uncharacterized protein n=1 Tax=Sporosarcina limicola TaxID=34101 RepID=A0A927MI07_9BACL|nr:hypothetical protein [Sporosarcina limicola]
MKFCITKSDKACEVGYAYDEVKKSVSVITLLIFMQLLIEQT